MTTITLYSEPDYAGTSVPYSSSNPNVSQSFPNGVKSCKVTGGIVTVYAKADYKAPQSQLAAGSYPDTSSFPSGMIVSLQMNGGGGGGAATITLYSEPNYAGSSVPYSSSNPNVSQSFPNGVKSCKVTGGIVTVYAKADYKAPQSQLAAGSYPDTSSFPSGMIVSLKIN